MKKNTHLISAGLTAAIWLALSVLLWFGPRTELSEPERRKLEQFPQISTDTLLSGKFMTKFETFTQDQFPFRDRFRQAKALFSERVLQKGDNNGIYLAEGYAAKLEYPLNTHSVETAVGKFQKIYDTYLKEHSGKIVFTIAPDKSFYLADRNGYPAMDYDALFSAFQALPWAQFVDISSQLDIGCYYTTDTHWRQEALLPAAQLLLHALDAKAGEWYQQVSLERPFYGVYYGQAALPMEPEPMYYLTNETLEHCTVINRENNKETDVYDLEKLSSRDLYDVFLSGAVSVLEITNPKAEPGRELIVFRDSFGSSMVPLLLESYNKVTLLDIRYVPTDYLANFVDFHGQDVLFLYSPLVLNQSAMLK